MVIGELQLGVVRVVAVAHEGERILLLRPFGGAQQLHAEHLRVEVDRALQVANAQHGVEDSHGAIIRSIGLRAYADCRLNYRMIPQPAGCGRHSFMPGRLKSCLLASLSLAALLLPPPSLAQAAAATGPSFDLEIHAPAPCKALLEQHLELGRYREVPDLDDAELARLATLAEHNARELLGTLGYFAPTVRITREKADKRPTLVVDVELGEKTVVGAVEITFEGAIADATDASTVAQREGIRTGWGLPAGQGFSQNGWDAAKSQALRRLAGKRFLAGRISESLADVDAAAHSAGLGPEAAFRAGCIGSASSR